MADKALFCTGAGGFIGRYLLSRYLENETCEIFLLEQGRFRQRLEAFLDQYLADRSQRRRVTVVPGDITMRSLGLDAAAASEIKERVTHVVHLAALYNLSAPYEASVRVNVDGTVRLLDFLGEMQSLQRFAHTSTIAVSGKSGGIFRENDLDVDQEFKNFYDETKFLAEQQVRKRRGTLPTVILRPTTVVGHSRTGAIEKVDGPYYALTMILRNMHAVIPNTGDTKFHFAPVDFVTEAYYRLFEDEEAIGKTFHIVDPEPVSFEEFIELACKFLGKRGPILKLPQTLMRPVGRLPMFERITGVPREAFEASFYPVEYDTTNARVILDKYGVTCPRVADYIETMIRYFVEHSDDPRIRKGDWRAVTS